MINQFSASIDVIQDRILFCFNTKKEQEFRLWLTRRCVADFLGTMPRHTEQSKNIISELEKSAELKKIIKKEREEPIVPAQDKKISVPINKESKQIKDQGTKPMSEFVKGKYFPIGEEPILVKNIKTELIDRNQKLVFYLSNNKNINCVISLNTFLSLHSLIEITSQKADWNIKTKDLNINETVLLN